MEFNNMIDTVICDDCLKITKDIPNESINLVVTSPPYNKGINYNKYVDDIPEKEYQEWQIKVIQEMLRVLKSDGSIFYNHKSRIVDHNIIFPSWVFNFNVRQIIIWHKSGTPILSNIRFYPDTEYIFWITGYRKTPKFYRERARYNNEVWHIRQAYEQQHPATFPLGFVKNCIMATTDENDIVLDPFGGSGTTAVACKQLNRRYIITDISEEYCDVAKKDLSKTIIMPNDLRKVYTQDTFRI